MRNKCEVKGCLSDVRENGTCTVDGCINKARSLTSPYCEKHYYRIRRNGSVELKEVSRIPPKRLHTHGYILLYVPDHPLAVRHTGPYEYEHRVVYYDMYGEGPFKCNWCGKEVSWRDMHIDHLNDKRDDNTPDNLVASCPVCNQSRGRDKQTLTMRELHGRWIEYNGQRKMLSEWAKELGISRVSLNWRMDSGWDLERALTERRGKCGPKSVVNS